MKQIQLYLTIVVFLICTRDASAQVREKLVLNHIAVYVNNLQKSTEFYGNVLGLQIIDEPFKDGRHSWFDIGGGVQLHVISGAKAGLEQFKTRHLCFSVTSMSDFIQRLDNYKIEYTNLKGDSKSPTQRPDGVKQIYFQDPDGYWIEINDDHQQRGK
jgi:lactoylglutathione lyase